MTAQRALVLAAVAGLGSMVAALIAGTLTTAGLSLAAAMALGLAADLARKARS
ncbi:hypothetical protein [Mycolicibacterium fortuitum]|uniref:hypothetical protein n=1 Tax=Mycolicibacterium fortuitum TaxID=1766 RepID=UPI0013F5DE93|nr:hypothetical protein [Mycolicibacterium fortuitum]